MTHEWVVVVTHAWVPSSAHDRGLFSTLCAGLIFKIVQLGGTLPIGVSKVCLDKMYKDAIGGCGF